MVTCAILTREFGYQYSIHTIELVHTIMQMVLDVRGGGGLKRKRKKNKKTPSLQEVGVCFGQQGSVRLCLEKNLGPCDHVSCPNES